MKRTTGGTFDPDGPPTYFVASGPDWLTRAMDSAGWEGGDVLCAVNDLAGAGARGALDGLLDAGSRVLLDSGIFNLSMSHARQYGVTMDEALRLAPAEIDGFDQLWDDYAAVVSIYRDRLWGIIELDQGGAANKRVTRARIEAELGIVPIPVYHPLLDGWDYFDELAGQYDRICFGNVVQAPRDVRSRLLHTLWERTRAYPDLWVHVLGVTPNPMVCAFPPASCDSSALISSVRYGQTKVPPGMTLPGWDAGPRFVYNQDVPADHPHGWGAAVGLVMSSVADLTGQWRGHLEELDRVGLSADPGRYPTDL